MLGAVRAFRSGRQLDLGPAKQRAVLAVLLLHLGKPVPTHRIVDAVWGDEPPENGANVVQKYVAGLRRILDPDRSPRTPGELLALTDGGYLLRAGSLDIEDFRNGLARADTSRRAGRLEEAAGMARSALDLWYGDALGGLTGPVFDAARNRLTEEHASAWELWAEIELSRGGFAGLVSELSHLVEEYPLREGLRAQLMIALYRSGRQAEALAVFRDAREFFLDELGAEPGERLQEIHRRILRNEPLGGGPPSGAASPSSTAPPSTTVFPSPASPLLAGSPPPLAAPPPPDDPMPVVVPAYSPASAGWPGGAPRPAPPGWPTGYAAPGAPVSPGSPGAVPHGWPTGALPGELLAPRRERIRWLAVLVAAVLPVATCTSGSWLYFAWTAVQRRSARYWATAAGYLGTFVLAFALIVTDPAPEGSVESTAQGAVGVVLGLLLLITSSVHGALLAAHPGDTVEARARRDLARHFAAVDPAGARQSGIGRPDLLRLFDDGGLIDLNHAPLREIARLPGVTPYEAHRIASVRYESGPYLSPDDLVRRGLLPAKTLRRLAPWLICVMPEQGPRA
ncbi:hypothetical protein GCM10025331_05460 [Actinoplanes utahensis]|nr:hypothetical protein Aut01nite_12720 [Actinoplanes utahensis]